MQRDRRTATEVTFRGRHLVLGTGTVPYVPEGLRDGDPGTGRAQLGVPDARRALQARRSITVVGSGQSAAEIYHDLLATSTRTTTR